MTIKKRAYSICTGEKNVSGVREKDPFLVYDDEKTRPNDLQRQKCKILRFSRYLFK